MEKVLRDEGGQVGQCLTFCPFTSKGGGSDQGHLIIYSTSFGFFRLSKVTKWDMGREIIRELYLIE